MKEESLEMFVSKLYDMNKRTVECLDLLQSAFIHNSLKSLDASESKAKETHQTEKSLTQELIEKLKNNPDAFVYVSVPGHLERVGDYLEDIIGCLRTKVKDGILFSDRAISEVTFLMQKIQEVLKNIGDIIMTRNVVLGTYVKESQTEISKSANGFATMHEERLIEGLCTPRASSLFLDIIDAAKGIAWHTKKIAEKLTT
ncbi:MAG: hypothetical protein WC560_02800 [Syntrophales bacterium]